VARAACLIVAVWLTIAARAFADPSVVLVVSGAADQDTAPFELRLRSEFGAEGLEVVTTSRRSQDDLLDLEGLARRTGAVAALSVYVGVQEVQGRLWVSDPKSNVDLVRMIRATRLEGDAVSVFALRAVEALRGARLELEQQRRRMVAAGSSTADVSGSAPATAAPAAQAAPPPSVSVPPKPNPPKPTPAPPKTPARAPVAPEARRWTALLAAVVGADQNGIGQIAAPALGVRFRWFNRISLGLAFEGPFVSQRRMPYAGVIQVDQELLDAQARYTAWRSDWFAFDAFLTTGISRVGVSGTRTEVPDTGRTAQALGWTFGVGLGADAHLTERWLLGLDLQWIRREPAPVIHAGTGTLTGKRDPLILGKLGVGFVF
jgi:hypothetical protein